MNELKHNMKVYGYKCAVDDYDNLMAIIRQSLTKDIHTIEANSVEEHLPSNHIDLHPGVKYPRPRQSNSAEL
jgi:hypothetical protein